MTRFAGKPAKRPVVSVYFACLLWLVAAPVCFAQTAPDDLAVPPNITDPQCSPVMVNCNAPVIPAAPDTKLVDPATAQDQAQRAKMQADRTQAEQSLQDRIEFARRHPNAVFVFGDKPQSPQESVRDTFAKALGSSTASFSSSTYDATGHRTECANACYGPFCCITTEDISDPLK
jgi:hypothetical protein